MADFTDAEIAALKLLAAAAPKLGAILGAIEASGVSDAGIANTLRIGDLTTQVSQIDDQISSAQKAKAEAMAAADEAIRELQDKRAAILATRQALPGGS